MQARPSLSSGGRAALARALVAPVDAASLVVFRAFLGLSLLWEVGRYLHPSANWLEHYYLEPRLRFGYWPLEWLAPLPAPWLQLAFALVGLAALCLAAGLYHRLSASLVCAGFCYLFLLDKARYLNHLYLVCLLAGLMILLPAHRLWSMDAWRRPALRAETVPTWALGLLRFQVAMPYVFGGLAKLGPDWLRGLPLGPWLARRTDFPLLGAGFGEPWMVLGMAWGAMLLDLLIVPLLLWRRTRAPAFLAILAFHLINARLFHIGIFPWLMIGATTIFLPPSWPRWLPRALCHGPTTAAVLAGGTLGWLLGAFLPEAFLLPQALAGAFGGVVLGLLLLPPPEEAWPEPVLLPAAPAARLPAIGATRPSRSLLVILALWIGIQLWLPLRHLLVPGPVHWTEEGHRYAWHMKLRDKVARARFDLEDPATGERWTVVNGDYLSARQESKMAARPDMLVQFARYLRREQAALGRPGVRVRAEVFASLNGRPEQRLVDPEVDLSRVAWPWWGHAAWILPLEDAAEAARVGLAPRFGPEHTLTSGAADDTVAAVARSSRPRVPAPRSETGARHEPRR